MQADLLVWKMTLDVMHDLARNDKRLWFRKRINIDWTHKESSVSEQTISGTSWEKFMKRTAVQRLKANDLTNDSKPTNKAIHDSWL